MTQAKGEWEDSIGHCHEPFEDVQFLMDAIKNGNMAKHFCTFIKSVESKWDEDHKNLTETENRGNFSDHDVESFFLNFRDEYDVMVKDGIIPAPASRLPGIGANLFNVDADFGDLGAILENTGVDPQVYVSMQGTPSARRIENDNPLADPNMHENPAGTDRAVIPRRRVQSRVEHPPNETQ